MDNIIREPGAIQQMWNQCLLTGQNVKWREKKVSELTGIFKNEAALVEHGDKLAYKVANQNFNRENFVKGNLQWGVTYLESFTVDGECAMTHGHFHGDHECDEYYFGYKGEGFLLFWDGADEVYAEKVFKGSLHYINGRYAHRLINTGDEALIVGACSLPASKQDHGVIEKTPFPYRCFKRNGKIQWVKED